METNNHAISAFIEKLLVSGNRDKSIIALDNYICEKCSWGQQLELLTKQQKNFYLNQELEREVNNGGFEQYFFNSTGEYANETVAALTAIEAEITAQILQDAIDLFPNSTIPKDQAERQTLIANIDLFSKDKWEELTQKFYNYEEDLNFLNFNYVKENHKAFY